MRAKPILRGLIPWLPAVVIMGLIFAASSTPSWKVPDFGSLDLSVKKIGHIMAYAALALAFLRGLRNPNPSGRAIALALCAIFAVTDEIHQSFVPGRNAAWYDVVIDSGGAWAGLLLWSRWTLLQRLTVHKPSGGVYEKVTVPRTGD